MSFVVHMLMAMHHAGYWATGTLISHIMATCMHAGITPNPPLLQPSSRPALGVEYSPYSFGSELDPALEQHVPYAFKIEGGGTAKLIGRTWTPSDQRTLPTGVRWCIDAVEREAVFTALGSGVLHSITSSITLVLLVGPDVVPSKLDEKRSIPYSKYITVAGRDLVIAREHPTATSSGSTYTLLVHFRVLGLGIDEAQHQLMLQQLQRVLHVEGMTGGAIPHRMFNRAPRGKGAAGGDLYVCGFVASRNTASIPGE